MLMWVRLWACLLMNACAGVWTYVQVACESGLLGLRSQMCEPTFFPAVRVRFLSTVWISLQEVLPQPVGSWSQDPELNGGAPLACMAHRVCSHRCLWAQDMHRMSAAWPGPTHAVVGGRCSAGTRASSPGRAPALSGDKAPVLGILSGMRVGSAPVRRGTGRRVEPGRSPSPYSLHAIQRPVFLALSVSPQLSLWLSILTVFCASFPSLNPHPPRTPPRALLGVCVSVCVCLSCC